MTLATSRAMRRLTVRWLCSPKTPFDVTARWVVLNGEYYYSDRAQLRRLRRAVQAEGEA
jgi:asparagine synthetase B (glutamine-hydrolysing)